VRDGCTSGDDYCRASASSITAQASKLGLPVRRIAACCLHRNSSFPYSSWRISSAKHFLADIDGLDCEQTHGPLDSSHTYRPMIGNICSDISASHSQFLTRARTHPNIPAGSKPACACSVTGRLAGSHCSKRRLTSSRHRRWYLLGAAAGASGVVSCIAWVVIRVRK
jgi:hypothetical protein